MAGQFLQEHYLFCLFYDKLHTVQNTLLYTLLYIELYPIFNTVLYTVFNTVMYTKLYTNYNVAGLGGLISVGHFPSCLSHIVTYHYTVRFIVHSNVDCTEQHTFQWTVYCSVHNISCL